MNVPHNPLHETQSMIFFSTLLSLEWVEDSFILIVILISFPLILAMSLPAEALALVSYLILQQAGELCSQARAD